MIQFLNGISFSVPESGLELPEFGRNEEFRTVNAFEVEGIQNLIKKNLIATTTDKSRYSLDAIRLSVRNQELK